MNLLSDSAKKRLPTAIKKLNAKEQAVFVFLRMRRDENYIAGHLDIPLTEVRPLVETVQNALAQSGAIDLIRNPVFYPIDGPTDHGDEDGPPIQYAGDTLDPADRIALDRFYHTLEKSLDELGREGRRMLGLWFDEEMTAKEILNFYKNLGLPLSNKKPIEKTTVQDVFYAIEKNIKNLATIVRSNSPDEESAPGPAALKTILHETGVQGVDE